MRLLNGLLRLRLRLLRIILHRSSVLRLWSGRLGGLILQTEQFLFLGFEFRRSQNTHIEKLLILKQGICRRNCGIGSLPLQIDRPGITAVFAEIVFRAAV